MVVKGAIFVKVVLLYEKKNDGKKLVAYPFNKIDCRLRAGTRVEAYAQKLLESTTKNQIRGVKVLLIYIKVR